MSNDPGQPEVLVALTARTTSPCIQVEPARVEFAAALVGRDAPRRVSIQSCSAAPLEVTSIRLVEDSGGIYTLNEEALPELPFDIGPHDADSDRAPPTREVVVVFTPPDEGAYGARLLIESSDPENPTIMIPIVGRGIVNQCPVAEVVNAEVDVLPLDVITLDASPSVDPDGPGLRPVRYEWTVLERPTGSTAQPVERFSNPASPADGGAPDDLSSPAAVFFVDLAGQYTIGLRVTDNLDLSAPSEACEQPDAVVRVRAVPDKDVMVQLVWDTPGDPDQTDGEGSDVDLHLLHPDAEGWFLAPLDCYYANVSPDWGPVGRAGNPSLDIDDTNGAGPEITTLWEPEDTTVLGNPYRVGVHYYRSENFLGEGLWGPSHATLRVFLSGELAGEWTRELAARDHFWEVAAIRWAADEQRVQEINRYFPEAP